MTGWNEVDQPGHMVHDLAIVHLDAHMAGDDDAAMGDLTTASSRSRLHPQVA